MLAMLAVLVVAQETCAVQETVIYVEVPDDFEVGLLVRTPRAHAHAHETRTCDTHTRHALAYAHHVIHAGIISCATIQARGRIIHFVLCCVHPPRTRVDPIPPARRGRTAPDQCISRAAGACHDLVFRFFVRFPDCIFGARALRVRKPRQRGGPCW